MPLNSLRTLVLSDVQPRVPAILRLLLGTVAIVRGVEAYRILRPLSKVHILNVPYVEWMPSPSQGVIVAIAVLWVGAALCFAVGYRTQVSGILLTVAMAAGLLIDQQGYSNHLYLLTVLVGLLTMSRPGGAWSLDLRHGRGPASSILWPLVLMKVQISVVYLFAAFTKFHGEYLSGRVLAGQVGHGVVPIPDSLKTGQIFMTLAISSILIEIFLAIYLWHPERRFLAVGAGVLLHATIPFLMQPFLQLSVFSAIMLSSYLLFLPPLIGGRTVGAPPVIRQIIGRLDVLRLMRLETGEQLSTQRDGRTLVGRQAALVIADELPASYLIAPFLRLPGVSTLFWRWVLKRDDSVDAPVEAS